jgi:colanic acid/amylovoran biosynthesis protein
VVFIGSPGPFSWLWRRVIARFVLNKVDMITNRDPISSEILKEIGINKNRIYNTACPAFLFSPREKTDAEKILLEEKLLPKIRPLVILIICGWNMPKKPFYKVPREKWELIPFVELVKYILNRTDADILLMSHQNRTDDNGNLIQGNDHAIISQLFELLKEETVDLKRIRRLQHLYDAASSKSIIGSADVLISGRIHGAVAGLSQCIPTLIIDYGHDPKAHKLSGFAKLLGIEACVCNPGSSEDMIRKFESCWIKKEEITEYLEVKIPHIKEKAKENFSLLKKVVVYPKCFKK